MFVVGNAKVYDLLQSIRFEYGNHLTWFIPPPGDWHVLYNYQKVLMKAYGDAGLVTLAKAAGYRAETLTSLIKAKNFRRTHLFLLQTYEAFYNYFLSLYISKSDNNIVDGVHTTQIHVKQIITTLLQQFTNITDAEEEEKCRAEIQLKLTHPSYKSLEGFMTELSKKQDTVKFGTSSLWKIVLLTYHYMYQLDTGIGI